MTEAWQFEGESVPLLETGGIVTLVGGTSFQLSGRSGDMVPGSAHGLFVLDLRVLSRLQLTVDGEAVEPLSVAATEPTQATFVGRTRPGTSPARGGPLLVLRRRTMAQGMREEIVLRQYGRDRRAARVELRADADFAHLFAVKEGRVTSHDGVAVDDRERLRFRATTGVDREVWLEFTGNPALTTDSAAWEVDLGPGEEWTAVVTVSAVAEGRQLVPVFATARLAEWRGDAFTIRTSHAPLREAVAQAVTDIGALRIVDPTHPERTVVAAGAPWFMTLFGRDSLLTSWMTLPLGPDIARGVLETLADFQGTTVDQETEEQPGRILHEVRFDRASSLAIGGGSVYYGTADATPLFVMLLGELRRWGLAEDVVARLLPAADRALEWVDRFGDRDGDGYVEYERATPTGLANQGWKDSWDGVPFADGRLAEAPIALCEVQGYVYSAYLARAFFHEEAGEAAAAQRWRAKARSLKAAFNRDFWLPDRGYFALALDRDKRPVDALASNMGHALWTGIVDEEHAPAVAERLLSPELFSGWGIRTLATSMASYDPLSYHCGSVWPHDNALAVAGLVRYGFLDEAHRVILGLLDAATAFGGRLPELFSGLSREEVTCPVAYPTSCSPQAWASATPLLFLRSLLRLDPWVPHGTVWLSPALPDDVDDLRVERVPLGPGRLLVEIRDGHTRIELPDGLALAEGPRSPTTAAS